MSNIFKALTASILLWIAGTLLWIAVNQNKAAPPQPALSPIIHDVCSYNRSERVCRSVPFYPGQFAVNDSQVWAYQPDGSLIYFSDVWYVGLCRENCT